MLKSFMFDLLQCPKDINTVGSSSWNTWQGAPSVITAYVVYKVVRATYGFASRGGSAKKA